MLNLLNWDRPIRVNGVVYPSATDALEALEDYTGEIIVELNWEKAQPVHTVVADEKTAERQVSAGEMGSQTSKDGKLWRITVRQYMTRKGDKDFRFHEERNNGIPMPMRTMVGEILDETRGLVKMRLRGAIMSKPMSSCMVCGRTITHPVSLLYGIGPECGKHYHINPFSTEEELRAYYDSLKRKVEEVTWEGWIIKSAILEKVEVRYNEEGLIEEVGADG